MRALLMGRVLLLFALAWFPGIARTDNLTEKQKAAAKRIYDVKCAKCHRMYAPADYPPEEWQLWAGKMTKKAKLEPAKEKLLLRYLESLRRQQSSTGSTQATQNAKPPLIIQPSTKPEVN